MINPKLYTFLRAIKKNNTKDWYDVHKDEYRLLSAEFELLLETIRDEVALFDSAVQKSHKAGVKTVKVFRLHRDARFSKNKAKYKTGISGLISADVKNPLEPVYYFAVEPGNKSFIGGGIRMPESTELDTIRNYIAAHYKKFEKVLGDKKLLIHFPAGLSDEAKLKKAPQGYDVDHPAIDLLRHKNFTIGKSLSDEEVRAITVKNILVKHFASLYDTVDLLRKAAK
jgi:uncharacterized protein (TIGR02453 family)